MSILNHQREDESVLLIGWDAAVDPRNTALVRVRYIEGTGSVSATLHVEAHTVPTDYEELEATVSDWAREDVPTLLCIDSPLGWPATMGDALSGHVAGTSIPASANTLFRRITDIDVRRRVGKTPLDVGADRIARTALATLNSIESIRGRLPRPIELPLEIRDPRADRNRVLLLETYPAGWFASEAIITRGYRPGAGGEHRRELLHEIERRLSGVGISLSYGVNRETLLRRADDLDALVCTLNGIDYLRGQCPAPEGHPEDTIRREGWIWCKDRSQISGQTAT